MALSACLFFSGPTDVEEQRWSSDLEEVLLASLKIPLSPSTNTPRGNQTASSRPGFRV